MWGSDDKMMIVPMLLLIALVIWVGGYLAALGVVYIVSPVWASLMLKWTGIGLIVYMGVIVIAGIIDNVVNFKKYQKERVARELYQKKYEEKCRIRKEVTNFYLTPHPELMDKTILYNELKADMEKEMAKNNRGNTNV